MGLVVLAAAAFAGGAYASTQDSASNTRQAFLNDVAKRLNVTPAQLNSAINGALQDQLNAAVKAGRLTQAQANAIEKRINSAGGLAFLGRLFGPVPGPGPRPGPGPGGPFPLRAPRAFALAGGPVSAAASYLGLSQSQLSSQLGSGKTLAQIAQARHKSIAGLKQAILGSFKARLDKEVAAKRLTSAQEQKLLNGLNARVNMLIYRKLGIMRGVRVPAPGNGSGPGNPPAGKYPPALANPSGSGNVPVPTPSPAPPAYVPPASAHPSARPSAPAGGGPGWGGATAHPGNYVPGP